ncbi:MAG: hypothetical protein ACI8QC_003056, partial [Planctomycetota bacterium]
SGMERVNCLEPLVDLVQALSGPLGPVPVAQRVREFST